MSEAFPVPRVLIAHVTDRCDLACAFCDLPKGPRDMPAADLERVLSQAREIGIANLVITGGMGRRAINLFDQAGVKVVVGAPSLEPEELVRQYLAGTLQTEDNICDH